MSTDPQGVNATRPLTATDQAGRLTDYQIQLIGRLIRPKPNA